MTAQEALLIVDQVFSVYKGTRQEHINLQEALRVLKEFHTTEAPEQMQLAEPEPENEPTPESEE